MLSRPVMCRFADSQKSRFQASKRSNTGSAVLEGGRSPDFRQFCIQAAKRSYMYCVEVQRDLFADCKEWYFMPS